MTSLTKYLSVCFFLLFCSSCIPNDGVSPNDNGTLIFGHFYGECFGERCVETFMLSSGELFEDTKDEYRNLDDFDFQLLSDAKYQLAKDLPQKIPFGLSGLPSQTFGCPDCGDQGGIIIILTENFERKEWIIDTNKRDTPDYLHDFVDEVSELIRALK